MTYAGVSCSTGSISSASPTSLLYRADLVRSRVLFFLEVDSGYFEDAELCFDVLENAKFGFIQQILTCTRWDNACITADVIGFDPNHRLMAYTVMKLYGSRYLSESEFESCFARAEREYYELLASGCLPRGLAGFGSTTPRGSGSSESASTGGASS